MPAMRMPPESCSTARQVCRHPRLIENTERRGPRPVESGMQAREGRHSRHILIYGPPGGGIHRRSVPGAPRTASRFSTTTLSLDVALRLVDFGSKECWELVDTLAGRASRCGWSSRRRCRVNAGVRTRSTEDTSLVSCKQPRMPAPRSPWCNSGRRAPSWDSEWSGRLEPGPARCGRVARLGRLLDSDGLETPINDDDLSITTAISPQQNRRRGQSDPTDHPPPAAKPMPASRTPTPATSWRGFGPSNRQGLLLR